MLLDYIINILLFSDLKNNQYNYNLINILNLNCNIYGIYYLIKNMEN